MYLLGLLSIVQIAMLPGLIFAKFIEVKDDFITVSITIFMTSLIANYLFVLALVSLGIYNRIFVFIIFFIEIIVLFIVFKIKKNHQLFDNKKYYEYINLLSHEYGSISYFGKIFIILFFLYIFLYYVVMHVYANLGNVFTVWDAVVSWNRWAIDWYNNRMPDRTWEYPQLMPTVWSVTYKFLGTEKIQFFAKGIMPLFGMVNLLIFAQLAINFKRIEFLIGGILYIFILEGLFSKFIDSGYVDIAVSSFSLMAVYCLLNASLTKNCIYREKLLVIGFIICGGALVVKQTGVFILLAYPVISWLLLRHLYDIHWYNFLQKLSVGVTIALVISLPWYGYKIFQLHSGEAKSNLQTLVKDIHEGRGYIERANYALYRANKELQVSIKKYSPLPVKESESLKWNINKFIYLFLICSLLGVLIQPFRWIHLIYTVPAFLSWLFLFSYDLRNVQPAIPFLSISTSFGLFIIPKIFYNKVRLIKLYCNKKLCKSNFFSKNILLYIISLLLIIFFINLNFYYDSNRLNALQITKQKKIGYPGLNDMIYMVNRKFGIEGKVLTSYQMFEWLPGLPPYLYMLDFFQNYNEFIRKEIDVNYLLYSRNSASPKVISFIDTKLADGDYELLFEHNSWFFIRKVH